MPTTKLLYLENFTLLECEAKVASVENENGKDILILDQTCFYPQGGGQPYDKGIINSPSGAFVVEEVRSVEGIVKHIGHFFAQSEIYESGRGKLVKTKNGIFKKILIAGPKCGRETIASFLATRFISERALPNSL